MRTLVKQLCKIFPSASEQDDCEDVSSFVPSSTSKKRMSKFKKKEKSKEIRTLASKLKTFDLEKLQANPLKSEEEVLK